MSYDQKPNTGNGQVRPISEGVTNRGGVNTNPSASLSRPAPPQPYKPQQSVAQPKNGTD